MSALRVFAALLLFTGLAAGEIKNKGWWRNTVFYQVYPRSFMDANNDGIGDLKGITNKLQHFKDSGIGAIWLSPIYASPMVDFGYDISDFRSIDKNYGSMEDLEELTKKAKELGIKVVMDLVPNHTSDFHEWFIKSFKGEGKYKDYYVWREGKDNNINPPNNWISVFSGPAWTYNATRKMWYFHQFEYRQPDLNYSNPNVRAEMEEIIIFWLDKGIDGFRVDAIPHVYEKDGLPDEPRSNAPGATSKDYTYLNHIYTKDDIRSYELIQRWRNISDKYANDKNLEEKVILTEAYTNLPNTTLYYEYGSQVPFNFNFIMTVNKDSKAKDFKNVIDEWMSHTPEDGVANWVGKIHGYNESRSFLTSPRLFTFYFRVKALFLGVAYRIIKIIDFIESGTQMGNHDRNRTATRYPGRADQMTMLAMVLPGIAVTYNGEEIAMEDKLDISWENTQDPQACNTDPDHYKSHSRDPNRTPFQWDNTTNAGFSKAAVTWLPVHENYKELNLEKQKNEPRSHYNIYKGLTALRSTSDVLKSGSLKTELLNDEVLAIVREKDSKTIILVINFSDSKNQTLNLGNYTASKPNVKVLLSSVGSKVEWDAISKASEFVLPAKAAVVLESNIGALMVASVKLLVAAIIFTVFKIM